MKKIIILFIIIYIAPIALGMECSHLMPPQDAYNCTITSLWNYGTCSNYHLSVYNTSGNLVGNFTYYNSTPYCQAIQNITTIGDYTGYVENGDTTSYSIQGEKVIMSFTVMFFMIVFTIGLFIAAFVARFSKHEATNYILKHLMIAGGILFLWFDITLLRQMASDAGLGIDNLLSFVWWALTLGMAVIIFSIIYTTLVGYMRMLKESEFKKRMGEDE